MLRIKDGFLIRRVANKYVVVPVGGTLDFNGLITLNETGAFFWDLLAKGCTRETLIEKALEEYDAERSVIEKDVDALLQKMQDADLLS